MADTQSSASTSTQRTIGRPFYNACDPCRRSKIRCEPSDDQSSACKSCIKKRIQHYCVSTPHKEFYQQNDPLSKSKPEDTTATQAQEDIYTAGTTTSATSATAATATSYAPGSDMPSVIPYDVRLNGFYSSVNEDLNSTINK
ncbi:uncharacterized protein L199_003181 [Kwoniella botswanensis]|uniref:uncharacterized protein n=1 Tax=Kwoniella botswanensis TaxID=1268659 RepID=UPI00315D4E09